MRRWTRAPHAQFCGFCPRREIAQGDPVLVVTLPTLKREMRRCVDCAGPAPPDLPPLPVAHEAGDFSMVNVGALKPKTRGAFKALVKEWMPYRETREPGDEG